ncbi:MAG TPA: mannose-6-phosphate isomerase, class I [Ilumatobacter sp.]|nr:mannose-6-phosphate isomerase, class I [Ilumatobacter sp.]
MQRVTGAVQHYAWGDDSFLPALLGVEPDGQPWAELWLGTHPSGPATLANGVLLVDVAGHLPYLLKVLSAAQPLSLQTHPTTEQAMDGFASGIYPDANAKPELLCALTPFEALCGVRPIDATLELLGELGAADTHLARVIAADGAGPALSGLYRSAIDPVPVINACTGSERPEAGWVRRLATMYPAEASVAATLLLNYVMLAPGDALRLDAGNLHAYLCGSGIELMGASDNVIRGGLTVKAVDVDELLRVVDPTPLAQPLLPAGDRYELPAAGVALIRLEPGVEHRATGHELTIDLGGISWYLAPDDVLVTTDTTFVVVPI